MKFKIECLVSSVNISVQWAAKENMRRWSIDVLREISRKKQSTDDCLIRPNGNCEKMEGFGSQGLKELCSVCVFLRGFTHYSARIEPRQPKEIMTALPSTNSILRTTPGLRAIPGRFAPEVSVMLLVLALSKWLTKRVTGMFDHHAMIQTDNDSCWAQKGHNYAHHMVRIYLDVFHYDMIHKEWLIAGTKQGIIKPNGKLALN